MISHRYRLRREHDDVSYLAGYWLQGVREEQIGNQEACEAVPKEREGEHVYEQAVHSVKRDVDALRLLQA